MKNQNKATAQILEALDSLGYNVDKIELRVTGPESDPYIEASVNLSRFKYPACHQDGDLSESPR